MKEKTPWYKNPIIVMSIMLVSLLVIIELAMTGSNHKTASNTQTSSVSDDDYDNEDSSSSEESKSSSSTSIYSTDSKTSLANLKADVSETPKANYENIETEVLKKADFDPTSANPSASNQVTAINNALKNVQKLADDAKNLANKRDSDYTQDDKNKLTNYSNALNEYLLAFKDYANITYQDKYTSEDPSTSQSDKQTLIDEMNDYKKTWTDKKNQWLSQYNSIIGQ